jgi:hypothetical protein
MPLQLNHTIVAARDGEAAARWFADLFGLDAPTSLGIFWQIETDNGVGMDFATAAGDTAIAGQHYAFLVAEDDFTAIYGRITDRGMDHWADPRQRHPGEINTPVKPRSRSGVSDCGQRRFFAVLCLILARDIANTNLSSLDADLYDARISSRH